MKGLQLAVDALAAYRVARFVVQDDAPAAHAIARLVRRTVPQGWAGAVDCQHCAGMWAALAFGVLRGVPGGRALAYPLAVAGAQSLLTTLAEAIDGGGEVQGMVGGASPSTADDRPAGWASGSGVIGMTERPR